MSYPERLREDAEFETPLNTRVAILDAGAQLAKKIDNSVRKQGVKSDIFPLDTPYEEIMEYGAVIISGGPESVYAEGAPSPDLRVYESGKPILGICYGMQSMNYHLGGTVVRQGGTDGPKHINVNPGSPLFTGLSEAQRVLLTHGDSVDQLAPGFKEIARSNGIVAAIANEERNAYGVQFHPEDQITENGRDVFSNFLFRIAELEPNYTIEDRLEKGIQEIRELAGDKKVLAFVSGGVDSTVLATMLGMALPAEQVYAVHVDTGFMRQNESSLVKESLGAAGINLEVINAEEIFLNARTMHGGELTPPLREVTDPEIKRHIIGDTFRRVIENVASAQNFSGNFMLAQGTLRPDLIESASSLVSSKAQVIKTHHNDTALIRAMRQEGRVIEPLKDLHKDEVRELGERLGLAPELVWRQPFPGPGLAIRLLCAKEPYVSENFGKINEILKSFEEPDIAVHLLPVRTVGVGGDGRSYSGLVALSGAADWPTLFSKAEGITGVLRGDINRVVYVFGDKFEQTPVDITPTFPEPEALEQLRIADAYVNDVLHKYGLDRSLSQVPVVSFPVNFGSPGERSIGIRTIMTPDFYTGMPAVPGEHMPIEALDEMVQRILSVPGVERVAYDLTSKPPATTEWE